jgi:hypothetical protein
MSRAHGLPKKLVTAALSMNRVPPTSHPARCKGTNSVTSRRCSAAAMLLGGTHRYGSVADVTLRSGVGRCTCGLSTVAPDLTGARGSQAFGEEGNMCSTQGAGATGKSTHDDKEVI